jgi:hypothetical protein
MRLWDYLIFPELRPWYINNNSTSVFLKKTIPPV